MKTETKEKVTVPIEVQDICRALAKTARENGLNKFSGKFQPDFSVWAGDVSFSWEDGRHGEDSNEIEIFSNFFIVTKIN